MARLAAAETVLRDWDDFVTVYNFPAEHWIHLRTATRSSRCSPAYGCGPTSPSACAAARTPSYLAFKIAQRLEHSWRPLKAV